MIDKSTWRCGAAACMLAAVLAPSSASGQGRPSHAEGRTKLSVVEARNKMVDEEIVGAGITNARVIESMRKTPRHEFVPMNLRASAYYDMALPIGEGQTISPPFVVAFMTESLDPQPTDKVLEIGTGSGYQAAVLSGLVREVYSIEIVAPLGQRAAKVLQRLRYDNVHTKVADGYKGWPENAPFDKIIVTCSPEKVPPALVEQLKEGGRIVIPVGQRYQQMLYLLKKVDGNMEAEKLLPTLFVPMTGAAEARRKVLPDPKNPAIENGDFEDTFGEPPQPTGWHYARQLDLIVITDAPSGRNYATFRNTEPGRGAQALQAFPIDGRTVRTLEVSAHVRLRNVRPGQSVLQLPQVGIVFYDENRAVVGEKTLGPWRGSLPWQLEKKRIEISSRAREAIMRIGLFGAVGEFSIDDIQVKVIRKSE